MHFAEHAREVHARLRRAALEEAVAELGRLEADAAGRGHPQTARILAAAAGALRAMYLPPAGEVSGG